MNSRHTDPPEQVQFQLAVPPALARELAALPDLTVDVGCEAPERIQHELALSTVASFVTITVNAPKLVRICGRIAEAIDKFFSASGDRQPRIKVIGERDEAMVEIHLGDTDVTADAIRAIVMR